MRCFFALITAVFLIAFAPNPVAASGDYGCTPQWSVVQKEYGGCTNSAILGPGNDTRVNLLLLMHDFYPQGMGGQSSGDAPLFEWRTFRDNLFEPQNAAREQSRCASDATGKAAFAKAVQSERSLSAEERAKLINVRNLFDPQCNEGMREVSSRANMDGIKSAAAIEFAGYLRGAMTFYEGDFDAAALDFASLRNAKNPWVRETASYMQARTEINRAQASAFDEYGYFDGTRAHDSEALAQARTGFEAYLKAWPNGFYARSARGLMRRAYWLGNNPAKLAAEYRWQLEQGYDGPSQAVLADEIDLKLLPRDNGDTFGDDPMLLAVVDLMRMRPNGGYFSKQISRSEIEAQRQIFSRHPDLYQYLLAAHAFYVADKPAEVLALIPDNVRFPRMGYLQFSRQALRGLALDAVKDRNARGFWEQLIAHSAALYQGPVAQLALAMNLERSGALAEVFAPASPVKDATIREILLSNVANPEMLRAEIRRKASHPKTRDIALFTLLYKDLSRGRYSEFVSDLGLTPNDAKTQGYFEDVQSADELPVGLFKAGGKKGEFACPHVRDSAGTLSRNPADIRAKLCVADFFRANGFDGISLDHQPGAGQLGSTKSLFPGVPYSRLELYKGLIADPKLMPDEKAYALYRAVYCYAPGGNNSCGGKNVPKSQRKAWHDQLKRDYPQSSWAKKLEFYW
jgi:hypothetical protein